MNTEKNIDLSEATHGTGMKRTFAILNAMVETGAIQRYALCGAQAAFEYIQQFATRDVDITVEWEGGNGLVISFDPIVRFLEEHGLPVQWDNEGLILGSYPVQFISPSSSIDRAALDHAVITSGAGLRIPIWTVEYLMAKCLEVYRPKDKDRLGRFLDEATFDKSQFKDHLREHGLEERWQDFLKRTGRDDI